MNIKKEAAKTIPKTANLSADIGGTNTRIYIYTAQGKNVKIWAKYFFKTQELKNFKQALNYVIKDTKVKIKKGTIAAAGPVSKDRKNCKITNAKWQIKTKELKFKTLLLNDFEALGYSINTLKEKDTKTIQKGKQEQKETKGLIGAGTGLGKAILIYDNQKKIYKPYASEGGHADLPIYDTELMQFLKGANKTIEYESIISGQGLKTLHDYYQTIMGGPRDLSPAEIMESKTIAAMKAKKEFIKYYARCAKNFALDILAKGGMYIGGGIAQKNPTIFGKNFIEEFLNNKTFGSLLKKIPIKIITKEDANIMGAILANEIK
ncbi:hypothetical protein DRJ22_01120 [Candidatus Woesearchaeota archaeon]|nr:MAG: hypothetical protein DRJ22_01120 [Candidatus Woesearchaeota archaeon]